MEHFLYFSRLSEEAINRGKINENKITFKNTIIKLQELRGKRIFTHIKKQIYIETHTTI